MPQPTPPPAPCTPVRATKLINRVAAARRGASHPYARSRHGHCHSSLAANQARLLRLDGWFLLLVCPRPYPLCGAVPARARVLARPRASRRVRSRMDHGRRNVVRWLYVLAVAASVLADWGPGECRANKPSTVAYTTLAHCTLWYFFVSR
jgi:hypothetical protein